MMSREEVVLVDERDRAIGRMEKYEAHVRGVRHRALSIVVVRTDGRLLLQRRALTKYHSPGLWTNTCCTHPRPRERPVRAAHRRLNEEMGLGCALRPLFSFTYEADVGGGLREHELDHVFLGVTDSDPVLNPDEVAEWTWMSERAVRHAVGCEPERFTVWFRILLGELAKHPSWAAAVPKA